mmetsp:Transcript_43410/g.108032  ORF Transcript_43410/g.108032 Transcript_43410/m.108032 type:complete len:83 (-) Transcript_43410:280-528(-)
MVLHLHHLHERLQRALRLTLRIHDRRAGAGVRFYSGRWYWALLGVPSRPEVKLDWSTEQRLEAASDMKKCLASTAFAQTPAC